VLFGQGDGRQLQPGRNTAGAGESMLLAVAACGRSHQSTVSRHWPGTARYLGVEWTVHVGIGTCTKNNILSHPCNVWCD